MEARSKPMAPDFIKGLELSEAFYREAVRPILDADFPGLAHSAGRLGGGSDVLGFDDETSRDHDWGPRLELFVEDSDWALRPAVMDALSEQLPAEILGYPTRFTVHDDGSMVLSADGPSGRHGVTVTTIARFFQDYVTLDVSRPPVLRDWLRIPPQRLRTISSGRLFHDDLGIQSIRDQLAWYPHDLWLYLMASQWRRVDQEEPFVGRTGDIGDALGSRLIAGRQVVELMRLCFLIERQHAPYFKWFGSAFAQLSCSSRLAPVFDRVLDAQSWQEREQHLSEAYAIVGEMHNDLGVTSPVDTGVSRFHDRPYLVPHSGRRVEALQQAIVSPEVRSLPAHAGAIWQFVDSTDILSDPSAWESFTSIYDD